MDSLDIHIPFNVFSASAITCAKNYVTLIEAQLSQAYSDERSEALEQYRSLSNADEADYEVYVRSVERMFEDDFRPILRFTIVIYLYIVFEIYTARHIADIQRLQDADPNILKRLKKKHECGLGKAAEIYFRNHAALTFFRAEQWKQLCEIEQVRHCIVHNAGVPRESKHHDLIYALESRRWQGELVGLEIDRYGGKDVGAPMILHQRFSEYCVSVLEDFFNALGQAAEDRFWK